VTKIRNSISLDFLTWKQYIREEGQMELTSRQGLGLLGGQEETPAPERKKNKRRAMGYAVGFFSLVMTKSRHLVRGFQAVASWLRVVVVQDREA
jgi:hypothetical protein